MKLPKCPICRKSAQLVDTIYKNDFGRYIIRCGCLNVMMRGHNAPDLTVNWKKWTGYVKAVNLERRPKCKK